VERLPKVASNSAFGRRYTSVPPRSEVPAATTSLDGESRDFDALFAANYAALARVICRVVGDAGWAEELAAEAFWKLHRQPPRSDHNLAGWLYRTGLRLALDHLKKRNRRTHYEGLAATAGSVSAGRGYERLEQQGQVRQVLAAIKPLQAQLLVLRSEGLSLGELAGTLDLNPSSVGTFLARAELAFRKEYVNRYGER
jgi:RNA polymerase sigma-70 factor (ECF subfamily)